MSKEVCRTCGESLREHVYGAATECRWNPTTEGSDLDPSYLLVKHQCWVGPNGEEYCRTCTADIPVDREPWPCLPYRLAEVLAEHTRMAGLTGDGCVPAVAYKDAVQHGTVSALRTAATAARGMHDPVAYDCAGWADWLDARAFRVENGLPNA